jgi:hypothetical protein
MTIGTLVSYRMNPEDEPVPGIVMKVWEDSHIELYVFHFEAVAHIRAAHPSQVEAATDAFIDRLVILHQRLAVVEKFVLRLASEMAAIRNGSPAASEQPALQIPEVSDAAANEENQTIPDEPELVESTGAGRRKGRTWPKA